MQKTTTLLLQAVSDFLSPKVRADLPAMTLLVMRAATSINREKRGADRLGAAPWETVQEAGRKVWKKSHEGCWLELTLSESSLTSDENDDVQEYRTCRRLPSSEARNLELFVKIRGTH